MQLKNISFLKTTYHRRVRCFIVDINYLCKSSHLRLTSVEAQKNQKLFQLCLKTELFFVDSPARNANKHDKGENLFFNIQTTRRFSQTGGLAASDSSTLWKCFQIGCTHRHAGVWPDLRTDLDLAVQIDHIQVDDGEYLHGHTRCAGVAVHQHFDVCVQGAAVERQKRGSEKCLFLVFVCIWYGCKMCLNWLVNESKQYSVVCFRFQNVHFIATNIESWWELHVDYMRKMMCLYLEATEAEKSCGSNNFIVSISRFILPLLLDDREISHNTTT